MSQSYLPEEMCGWKSSLLHAIEAIEHIKGMKNIIKSELNAKGVLNWVKK